MFLQVCIFLSFINDTHSARQSHSQCTRPRNLHDSRNVEFLRPHGCWADTPHLIYLNTHKLPPLSLSPHFCFQLINAVSSLDRTVLNQLHVQLMELRGCKGHKQCNPRTRSVEPGKTNTHTLDKRHSYSCC